MTLTPRMSEKKGDTKTNKIDHYRNNTEENEKKSVFDLVLTYLLRNHNWIFVMALMPISVCYDVYCFCKYYLLILVGNCKVYKR